MKGLLVILFVCLCTGGEGQRLSDLQVNVNNLRSHLFNWFGRPRNHLKQAHADHKDKVKTFLRDTLSSIRGANVVMETVHFPTTVTDWNGQNATGTNFYLLMKGKHWGTKNDKIIALTSQYDTYGEAPGVDNNGSGMAAFLEIVRLLGTATCEREYTILLVANDFEEYGSLGIKEFIYNYLVPRILKNGTAPDSPEFQGAIVFETMMNWNDTEGSQALPVPEEIAREFMPEIYKFWIETQRKGTYIVSVSRNMSDTPLNNRLMYHWNKLATPSPTKFRSLDFRLPCEGVIKPGDFQHTLCRPLMRADYKEFYYYNGTVQLKALMVSDSGNYRGVMRECYAKPCDDLSQVTDDKLVFLGKSAKMTLDTLLDMSGYKECTVSGAAERATSLFLALVLVVISLVLSKSP